LTRLGSLELSATARVRTPRALDAIDVSAIRDDALSFHNSARTRQDCVTAVIIAPDRRWPLKSSGVWVEDDPDRRARVNEVDRVAAVTGKTRPGKQSVVIDRELKVEQPVASSTPVKRVCVVVRGSWKKQETRGAGKANRQTHTPNLSISGIRVLCT
jgi:hypothetical protein